MGTRALTLRAHLAKGKSAFSGHLSPFNANYHCRRFGWVNASYVYGLEILNAHMRRSLGPLTPWETYKKAISAQDAY